MRGLGHLLFTSTRDFFRHGGVMNSAALSFFSILDIVPLCIFSIGVAGYVLGSDDEIFRFILERLLGVFPVVTEAVTAELKRLIQFKQVAVTSLVLYAFFSFQLYRGVHRALASVFGTRESVTFLDVIVKPVVLVTLVFFLLLLSFILTTMVPMLSRFELAFVDLKALVPVLLRYVLPLLLVQFTALIVYVLVPVRNVRVDDAFWGGLFTAVMMEAAKHLFTWYVGSVSRLGTMYGSMAVFVTFLIWLYYSWAIFLIGAEMVRVLGEGAKEGVARVK
jgi:membrane protein